MPDQPGFHAPTGVFVCFEGGEGAGKSTQTRLLEEWLRAEGYSVRVTFEPGDAHIAMADRAGIGHGACEECTAPAGRREVSVGLRRGGGP